MKLSIIIPIYNGALFLRHLMSTIHAFTFRDFECVFIDNNSTDHSLDLLRDLLKEVAFPYVLLTEPKKGAGYARNTGIQSAKGEYLAFLDCDDVILPEKFVYDFSILKENEVDFVFCRAKRIYEDGRMVDHPINGIKEGVNNAPAVGILWLKNFFMLQGTGSLVVRKSAVIELGGFHTSSTGEDAFLFIRLGLKYKGFFYDKILFHYLRHPQSTISKSNKTKKGALLRYFELRKNFFVDDIFKWDGSARRVLMKQLQMDILKLQHSGENFQDLIKDRRLKELKLSFLLFNPLSLFLNCRLPHVKYNPFYQIYIRIDKDK